MIKSPTKHRKLILIILASLSSIALICWGVFLLTSQNTNRAAEVAKPLEQALVEAGGIKMCSNGDDGKGWDNRAPYYGATYGFSVDKFAAIKIVNQIAANNGYGLVHASTSNRGFLNSVADDFVDDWYFDDSSKASDYSDMSPGKIRLSAVVYGEGQKSDCTHEVIAPGHSTIGIGVYLPDYR